jgi:hypothetical protein
MTAAVAFPTSQTIASWERQIGARQPLALWTGYLRLHRVEALAEVARLRPLDGLSRSLLTALGLESRPVPAHGPQAPSNRDRTPHGLADLTAALGLDRPFLRRLLEALERDGCAAVSKRGEDQETWTRTPEGKHALELGMRLDRSWERRVFPFVVSWDSARRPQLGSAACLANALYPSNAVPPCEPGSFDPELLVRCVAESPAWKKRRGFPEEIVTIAREPVPDPQAWRRVIMDRQERLWALLLREPGKVAGFGVRLPSWTLVADQPYFLLEDGEWEHCFPELTSDPPPESWRASWLAWGQARGLPPAELDACLLERAGVQLRVLPERRLLERLRSARNEVSRGETWLLAGSGAMRACAAVEIVERG